jgi:hypothetical protein
VRAAQTYVQGLFFGSGTIGVDVSDRNMAETAIQEMNRASKERTALLQSQEQLLKILSSTTLGHSERLLTIATEVLALR